MDHPVMVAPCPILFAVNGGRFDDKGRPIFDDAESDGVSPRAKCSRAYDCGTCSLLHNEISYIQLKGWVSGWECVKCIEDTKIPDKENGVTRKYGEFYQAGRAPWADPFGGSLGEFDNSDPDNTPVPGCTRCGWQSSFLQLIMRRRG